MSITSYLQGGSGTGISLQGTSSPQKTASSPQTTVTAQQVQPTSSPIGVYSAPSGSGGGTGLGLTTQPQPQADPYAQWGGRSAYNSLVSGFGNQKQNIFSSANDAAKTSGINMRNSILDLIEAARTAQTSVDNRGINNELARQRGTSDIYGMVNRGITSGGVTLNNRNAADSSAAGAIARAYGNIGQRELSDVNNQYELENKDLALAQENVDMQERAGLRRIESDREMAVNNIVSDANNQLAALDTAMANASLPERIAIDAEKNKIRSQVLDVLSRYDSQLGEVNQISPMERQARIAEATRRNQLGQANPTQFDYMTEAPAQFQNTGPYASTLPIFTYRNNNEDQ